LLPSYGLRELACGVGILGSDRPAGWLWGRVAGDALDLATLATAALADDPTRRGRAQLALLAVVGVTALDVVCAAGLSAGE
jgi:hypothetical protein